MSSSRPIGALRSDARHERSVLVEHRARCGEDPADFVPELPDVDELVVATIVDEVLTDRGLLPEVTLARLAAASHLPDADEHRANVDRIELLVLREVAADHPELTRAVWSMIGRIGL